MLLAQLPNGTRFWLQPVIVNQAGVKQWGAASTYKPSDAAPLDRTNANIVANVMPGERSMKLTSKSIARMTRGKEKFTEADIMSLEVLETLSSSRSANIALKWGKGQFLEEFNKKRVPRRPIAFNSINNHVHGFACSDTGAH